MNSIDNINSVLMHLFARFMEEEEQKPALAPPEGPFQPKQLQFKRLAFGFDFYIKPRLSELINWTQTSREITNFTYDLTENNIAQLAGWVSVIKLLLQMQCHGYRVAMIFVIILINTSASDGVIAADLNMGYGRRLGWYALVRALKQDLIETGVDKVSRVSLQLRCFTIVLKGTPVLFGTDINPRLAGCSRPLPRCR